MKSLHDEYRSLLTSDESVANLDAVVKLILRASEKSWTKKERQKNGNGLFAFIREEARQVRRPSNNDVSPRIARVIRLLDEIPARMAHEPELESADHAFLMDLLLLLFHQAYFSLLPKLHGKKHGPERAKLLSAFREFGAAIFRDADRFWVLGLVSEALGKPRDAADYYRKSLNATHADDHDFITRAQLLWTHLHESGNLSAAGRLLLDLYPRVQRKDLDEITEMIWETMQAFERRGRRNKLTPMRSNTR